MSSDAIIFGLSHVEVPVRDLARAERVYAGVLGFSVRTRGDGWLDLDAGGTVSMRFVQTANPEHRASLRVHSSTVQATVAALVAAGCRPSYEVMRTPELELLGAVTDPDGHALNIWRPLSEDEYEVAPALPTELTWSPDAEVLLKSLLRGVPALFRALARRRVVKVAESLVGPVGVVGREEVIRGFILSSPKVTRGRNRRPLVEHGIDVERYREDWDAD